MSATLTTNVLAQVERITPESKRARAVAAALEVIAGAVAGTQNANLISGEMARLSEYADLIQAAVNKK